METVKVRSRSKGNEFEVPRAHWDEVLKHQPHYDLVESEPLPDVPVEVPVENLLNPEKSTPKKRGRPKASKKSK